jgi:hypothetical protein
MHQPQIHIVGDFPPEIWADDTPDAKRTNNAVESWHSKINGQLYSKHPNIFVLVDLIVSENEISITKLRSSHKLKPENAIEKNRIGVLRRSCQSFRSGQINMMAFVKQVSYHFRAKTT